MGIRPAGRRVNAVTSLVLAGMLVLTGVATWLTHQVVHNQERTLLAERTSEVRLVLTTAVDSLTSTLTTLGTVLQSTGNSHTVFTQATTQEVRSADGAVSFALLRPAGGGYRVDAASGSGLHAGQVLAGDQGATAARAAQGTKLYVSPIHGTGAARTIDLALGVRSISTDTLLFEQVALGPVSAPRSVADAAFREVRVVLYATPRGRPGQVLVTTTRALPLQGTVDRQRVPVGGSTWLLAVDPVAPLVGTVAANAQWFVLGAGILLSLLVAAVVQVEGRRRAAAVALYDSEHQVAETLQRSLLPALPELAGLDLAARYLVGGTGQQVGGDWFDAFPIDAGQVGVVIGDVIGHDVVAATGMSQIRAALRAYAWQGEPPAEVLERLDQVVDAFHFVQLVTVFYGVLSAPSADGSRRLHYANAGHIPPLVKLPGGDVRTLRDGHSIVIGATRGQPRSHGVADLPAGSTLLLYTDGLVEVPGSSIEDTIIDLTATVRALRPDGSADTLCEQVVAAMPEGRTYDDVALLAIRILAQGAAQAVGTPPGAGDRLATGA